MAKSTRRSFLLLAGSSSLATVLGGALTSTSTVSATPQPATVVSRPRPKLPSDLFQLGVASGDPLSDSVVLWMRLAPEPLKGGGMPNRAIDVRWEIADDAHFTRGVRRGTAEATPDWGHSVHVDVRGLRPGADYFYRFRVDGELSPVGHTRTAPAPGAQPDRLRFAFASCQNFAHGYFVAHRDLAQQDLDFVVFLGDYIYESPPQDTDIRRHEGDDEPYSLRDYRNRYGQYKSDEDLREAHAAYPWIVTLDDHEVDNDFAGLVPQDPDEQSAERFRKRRIAAFQAWYEHMPVRASSRPTGESIQVYRRFDYGGLARIHVLDTRQYRTDQPATPDDVGDPDATMTGREQEEWLVEGLHGRQRWNIIANQTPMAQTDREPGAAQDIWTDPWDGYPVQRARLFKAFGSSDIAHPLVCTGDRHFTMACDLRTDFNDPDSSTVATEVTGTSISSGGDGDQDGWHADWDQIIEESPHWKYGDGRRGYAIADVTAERAEIAMRIAPKVSDREGKLQAGPRFVADLDKRGIAEIDETAGRT